MQGCSDGLLVVHHQPEVARLVWRLGSAGGYRDELVGHIDERHRRTDAAAHLELEETSVPREGVIDVADLERNVVNPNEAHGWPAYSITVRPNDRGGFQYAGVLWITISLTIFALRTVK